MSKTPTERTRERREREQRKAAAAAEARQARQRDAIGRIVCGGGYRILRKALP